MGTNIRTPMNCLRTFICLLYSSGFMSTVLAVDRVSYYESEGGVDKYSLKLSDDSVEIVRFVKLLNGSLHLPKLYYKQGHQTMIGVRDVEKEGGLSIAAGKKYPGIMLPVAKDIDKYIFLVRTTFPVNSEKDGQAVKEWKFTDWSFIEVSASDVTTESPISIPSIKELSNRTEEQEKLFKKLIETYDVVLKDVEEQMKQPITDRSKVPWYAR